MTQKPWYEGLDDWMADYLKSPEDAVALLREYLRREPGDTTQQFRQELARCLWLIGKAWGAELELRRQCAPK